MQTGLETKNDILEIFHAYRERPFSPTLFQELGEHLLMALTAYGYDTNFEIELLRTWSKSLLFKEYESVLDWIDVKFDGRPIAILDIATGNGVFSYLARTRGHTVVATHDGENFFLDDRWRHLDPSKLEDLKLLVRDFIRLKLDVPTRTVLITRPPKLMIFDPWLIGKKFDFVYIGQATFHWPTNFKNDAHEDFWGGDHWRSFIDFICENFLHANGYALMTLARDAHDSYAVSDYLRTFAVGDLFTISADLWFAGWKSWDVILITPENRPEGTAHANFERALKLDLAAAFSENFLISKPVDVFACLFERLAKMSEKFNLSSNNEMDLLERWSASLLYREYENILDRIDGQFDGQKISILDIATGNGLFNYLAKKRGHRVVSTHEREAAEVSRFDGVDTKPLIRDFIRNFLNVDTVKVEVLTPPARSEWGTKLSAEKFDFVYCGQATFHCLEGRTWNDKEWILFLNDMATAFLKSQGCILITFTKNEKLPFFDLSFWQPFLQDMSYVRHGIPEHDGVFGVSVNAAHRAILKAELLTIVGSDCYL